MKKMLLSEISRAASVLAQKGKRKPILVEACSGMKGWAGSCRGVQETAAGEEGWETGVLYPRVGLSGRPGREAWGDLGGFRESLPLTNVVLPADKVNVSVYQAVLTLPVHVLRHQVLDSIFSDI